MEEETKFLRALLRQDWETYDSFTEKFQSEGKGTPVAIIGYSFFVAVQRRFAENKDAREIIRFVADARARLLEGRELPAKEGEALIYAMLDMDMPGVEEIVEDLDVGVMAEIQGQLLFRLVEDAELTDEQLDELLLEAEALLHENHPVE
ncbi:MULTISPECIES: hypothetical protein [unclassified Micromonospora]|uniref:hypothetical protein n=1 Tax=unclassified Micromonospora TaxID=2617518 RepID=UPI003A89A2C6